MEFFVDYGLFLAKVVTILVAIVALIIVIKSASSAGHGGSKGNLEVTNLTENYKETVSQLENHLYDEAVLKARHKEKKKQEKAEAKAKKKAAKEADTESLERKPRLFVLDFKGSIDAREVTALREEVSAVLAVSQQDDEVLVRLESGGGMVHGYGLASSQLDRLSKAGVKLTVSVDKVAASGGYMMACVADKILAAPFAIVGSIGVIAQLPNFNKLLKKHDIEFEQHTAGEFKRTLTMFGENGDKAREKFQEELEETHVLFKSFVNEHRPDLDIAKVATGEHWFGRQAVDLGLVDEITTSDDYLTAACKDREVLHLHYAQKKKLAEKLAGAAGEASDSLLLKWIGRGQRPIL
ncbi:protease SohB [Parasalinivibrio latis]|uniref:protease SohB n=1 Tax=Parasalinivibrio latis TaxID=2952610 RepID=UPI0030DF9385